MWPGAIDHEHGIHGILCESRLDDLRVRDVDCAGYVTARVQLGAAHVDEHEIRPSCERIVHVPTVRFESEELGKVLQRERAVGGRDLCYCGRHGGCSLGRMWRARRAASCG